VPKALRTPAICLAAVQQNGNALTCAPLELRKDDICLAAVQQNWNAVVHVPTQLTRAAEIYLAAVQ